MNKTKTLYIISAEKDGEGYWKVSSSTHEDPLKEDKNHFLECFRKDLVGASAAKDLEKVIALNIDNVIADCIKDGFDIHQPTEGISYDLPLNVLEEIYDFWLDLYTQQELWERCLGLLKCRSKISFAHPAMIKGLTGFTAEWGLKIEALHTYRPPTPRRKRAAKNPMWV